jgi:hypothetical protein
MTTKNTNTPPTSDGNQSDKATSAQKVYASTARKLERERDAALKEVKKWKEKTITFGAVFMAPYGRDHYGEGMLHPDHYDILKDAGARMDDFKRA